MRLLRFELQRKSVQFETVFGDIPVITADPNKLKQVIINLIMNAVHALEGEGRVVLETGIGGDGMLQLCVRDNGPGIPEEIQEQIFAPFYTTKPEGEGTGLGLYICQNIVREHSGTISVQSLPGEGTTFCISLPQE